MKQIISVLSIATLAFTAACGKDEKASGGGGGGGAAKTKPHTFKSGITADLPTDVDVGSEFMLTGRSIGAMSIDLMDPKKTLDEAKADADMFSPKDLKVETLPDGFVLTFSNTGAMGANHFLEVYRDVGGKQMNCSTNQPDTSRLGAVRAVCMSMRP